jgi:hypothetical protein
VDPKPVWTIWRGENSLPYQDLKPTPQLSSLLPVAIPTVLPWLLDQSYGFDKQSSTYPTKEIGGGDAFVRDHRV